MILVTLVPEAVGSTRTIDVTVSRYAFSPERIEVRVGERVRLNVVSVDGTYGCQVKALGLNAGIPSDGRTVTVELTPKEVGTFEISCSKNGINVPADRAAAILNNRAGHYFNVHTAINPDGAIRGQLSQGAFDPGTAIPY